MRTLKPIHPFPARMAPELVFTELAKLKPGSLVLDPMSGSGTVTRASVEIGHRAIGFDVDPLAVLMARVWITPIDTVTLMEMAHELTEVAKTVEKPELPWIDTSFETSKFINFWFEERQVVELRKLSYVLNQRSGIYIDALKIALSRIIITKEKGASVARDTSHSRPHRVFFKNEYDVMTGFLKSVSHICTRLEPHKIEGVGDVTLADARNIKNDLLADAIITSPPYLNAIDYLRGHRLSLVWLGYGIEELRAIRSGSVGAEKAISKDNTIDVDPLISRAGKVHLLPSHSQQMIRRYASDLYNVLKEFRRMTKRGGKLLLVVGDSCLKNIQISNAEICIAAAESHGYKLDDRVERPLPTQSRYLPPPKESNGLALNLRMRSETILSFRA